MNIKERIEIFIERQGIKRSVFEKSCGFSNGYTRNLKENPSVAKVEDILNAYPELNRVWLLSGEGEMLRHSAKASVSGSGPAGGAAAPVPAFRFLRFISTCNGEFLVNADNILSVIPSGEYSRLRFRQPVAVPNHRELLSEVEVQGSFESVSQRLAGEGCPDDRMDF